MSPCRRHEVAVKRNDMIVRDFVIYYRRILLIINKELAHSQSFMLHRSCALKQRKQTALFTDSHQDSARAAGQGRRTVPSVDVSPCPAVCPVGVTRPRAAMLLCCPCTAVSAARICRRGRSGSGRWLERVYVVVAGAAPDGG